MSVIISKEKCKELLKKPVFLRHVDRALRACGTKGRYILGQGGFDPTTQTPYGESGGCDCSGFGAWVMELSRKPKPTRPFWIESTAIYRDGTGKQIAFIQLADCVPGALLVYPDRKVLGVHFEGHVAVIVGPNYEVADCKPSNWKKGFVSAIRRGSGAWMRLRGAKVFALKQDVLPVS